MLHGVQGGYYWKSFGKHGPLHNPYAYGYFDHVPPRRLPAAATSRSAASFYEGDAFPPAFRGRYIAADLLGHAVHWHEVDAARLDRSGPATAATCCGPTTPGSPPAT